MTTDAQFRDEERALRELLASGVEQKLRALPNVFHVSVGLKERSRRLITDRLCIRVYVRDKKSLAELEPAQRVPADIGGIPTDVNVMPAPALQADNTRYRPIKGGIQISNGRWDLDPPGTPAGVIIGTLGCMAIDKSNKDEVFLSNHHVLQGHATGPGIPIHQPAPIWFPNHTAPAATPSHISSNADRIAVVSRTVFNTKVDAGIAKIDVSSCCHCCGIHFSNEINGLSVAGRPHRTIEGDEPAVAGMTVFKVGATTLRTEGKVVDTSVPDFVIPHGMTNHSFIGQMSIQNVDTTKQFSDIGDSGAAVINDSSKIVGLLFAGGQMIAGAPQPFVSYANHIAEVLTALNIEIKYSSTVKELAGEPMADAPSITEAKIPQPYRELRERLERSARTALIFDLGRSHAAEIRRLINHCRPVTVAWHRAQGPALFATLMGAVRDGHYRIPPRVKGVALHEALERMRVALAGHGSPALRATMARAEGDALIAAVRGRCDLNEIVDELAGTHAPAAGAH